VRFEVIDTGAGIPLEAQHRLFQPFTQADSSSTRRHGGTGLGLAISKQLAELLGGSIGFESAPGKGSRFWVDLPLAPSSDPTVGCAGRSMLPSGARVLCVDDCEDDRRTVERMLAGPGVTCDGAGAGEALGRMAEAARSGAPYDVVVLDVSAPGAGALAIAERALEDPEIPRPRFVALAPHEGTDHGGRLRALGVQHELRKPVRSWQLRECVAAALPRVPRATLAPPPSRAAPAHAPCPRAA
jgi:CheY-like chemotaxis protein